jgi:hypothetical protein
MFCLINTVNFHILYKKFKNLFLNQFYTDSSIFGAKKYFI